MSEPLNVQHTPGPWTAEGTTATGIRSIDIIAGDENEWSLVATVAEPLDAALIATAPELLRAAQAFLRATDNEYVRRSVVGRPEFDVLYRTAANLIDAIAKAEGREP